MTQVFEVLYFLACCVALKISLLVLPEIFALIYEVGALALFGSIAAEFFHPFFKRRFFHVPVSPQDKAVLITGCDTGFGHETAKRLDSKGFHVFATCLHPTGEGAKKLKEAASNRLHVLELDVSKKESVKEAVAYVKSHLGKSELWALINNAGVYRGTCIALTGVEDFKAATEVNAIGTVRVTKAFLPLLIQSKGRIITVTGFISKMFFPLTAAYTMSKVASTAFCEILRQEVKRWGIKVIEIQPELFRTPIASRESMLAHFDSALQNAEKEILKHCSERFLNKVRARVAAFESKGSPKVSKVVDHLEDAVTSTEPCQVYKPRRNVVSYIFLFLGEHFPKSISTASLHPIWKIGFFFASRS